MCCYVSSALEAAAADIDAGGGTAGGAGAGVGVPFRPKYLCKVCRDLTDKDCGGCGLPFCSIENCCICSAMLWSLGCGSTPDVQSQDDADDGQIDEDAPAGGGGGAAKAMDADDEADGAVAAGAFQHLTPML